jgi:hypothetical protein
MLSNGTVLVVGGPADLISSLDSAELYHPTTGTWSNTGTLATGRYSHTETLLSNGTVLVAGGFNRGALTSAELYDPIAGTWSTTPDMATARASHTATMLGTGTVLVAAGLDRIGLALASAELYDPCPWCVAH